MNAKITQGKRQLWQWDTGVQLMLFDIGTANEVHFATPDGVIRRDIVNGMCNIPDVVLQRAGTMVCYVFNREPYEGDTRHEFHFEVLPRPKPADYIDPPEEADNLEQLAERVASIIGPGSGGGTSAPEIMKITFTSPDGGDNIEPDKTFAEMRKALASGKLLYAEIAVGIDTFDGQFQLYYASDDAILFTRLGALPGDTPMLALQMVGVNSDNEVVSDFAPISGGGGSGAMFVAFTSEDGENWKASKPFAEVYEAYMNGQMVYAHMDGTIVPALNIDSAAMHFMLQMYYEGVCATAEIIWNSDNSVAYAEDISPIGGGGGNVVAVTLAYDGNTIKPSHTSSEIYNLVKAGNTVLLQYGVVTCTAELIGESKCVFEHMGYSTAGDKMTFGDYMTITIAEDVVTLKDHMSQSQYPNPHPLVINGVSYDGSERVEIKEGEWELIETITVSESDTGEIKRSQTPGGATYNYKKIFVRSSVEPAVGAAVMTIGINAWKHAMSIPDAAITSKRSYSTATFWIENGIVNSEASRGLTDAYSTTNKVGASFIRSMVKAEKIMDISISLGGGIALPAGSVIEIWGVRA